MKYREIWHAPIIRSFEEQKNVNLSFLFQLGLIKKKVLNASSKRERNLMLIEGLFALVENDLRKYFEIYFENGLNNK